MTDAFADDVIQRGLTAGSRGDLDALETILDPAVTLRAMQPGRGYCDNREQVMKLLARHETQRSAHDPRGGELRRVGDRTYHTAVADQGSALTGSSYRPLM